MAATDIRSALAEQRKNRAKASWLKILKETASEWVDDDVMTWSAAVACYTLLALAPLLVIAIKVLGVFYGGPAANQKIQGQAVKWMGGQQGGNAIAEILKHAGQHGNGIVATIVSAIIVVISAGGVFSEFQGAMNRIWKVKPRAGAAAWDWARARILSIIVVAIAAVLLLASVFVVTWLENLTKSFGMGWTYVTWIIDVSVSVGVLTVLFGLLYKTVPDARIGWRSTLVGALISAILFEIGKYALAAYFKFAAPASAFGAAGSLAAVLIWVYYSCLIGFFGAEFTQVHAKLRGHGVIPSKHARPLSECDEAETATPSSTPPEPKPPKPAPRGQRPPPSHQYAAVLDPFSQGYAGRRTGNASDASRMAPATRTQMTRAYFAAGAGLAVGALIGGLGALHARPGDGGNGGHGSRPGSTGVTPLRERIRRVEKKLGHVSRIKHYLEQQDVNQRIDDLEDQIRRAARRRPAGC